MERVITIVGRTGRFDEPSFLLTENEDLKIRFKFLSDKTVGRYVVVVRHGIAPKKTFSLTEDKSVLLPSDWLNKGGTDTVDFELQLLNKTETAILKSDYAVESLIVSNEYGTFKATAEMQFLERKVDELQDKINSLEQVIGKLTERVEDYENNGILETEIE